MRLFPFKQKSDFDLVADFQFLFLFLKLLSKLRNRRLLIVNTDNNVETDIIENKGKKERR